MAPLLYLFFLVCIGCSQGGLNDRPIINNWYETWIKNSVVAPFLTAYTTLNKKIIEKVMSVDPNSNEKAIQLLIGTVKCRFETVHKQLRRASDGTVQIRTSLEREERILLQRISSQENLVRSEEKNVNEAKLNIDLAEEKLKLNEVAVNKQQGSVNTAEHDVRMAQDAVDESNNCRRRRRKKRFLGLCNVLGVFTWKGSKNAHERLSLAVHNKHSVQHRLQAQQQTLRTQQFRHETAKSQLTFATAQLLTLQSKLNQTQTSFKHMTSFSKEFKEVVTYLTEVLGSSTAFKSLLKNLIDFEHVIEPLDGIYQQMVNNKLVKFNDINASSKIKHQTSEDFEKVKEMIESMNILVTDENPLRIPCAILEKN